MSRYRTLLQEGLHRLDVQQRAYGAWPSSIADTFGVEEFREALEHIAVLEQSRAHAEEGDGDSQDDIWRDQQNVARLLSASSARFPEVLGEALSHPNRAVAFWAAWAMGEAPQQAFVAPLQAALSAGLHASNSGMYGEALSRCRRKPGLLGWFRR